MAITINSSNQIYNPAYNEMVITVVSTNIAQTNFKYIADIYIGSDVIRLTAPKNPTYTTGVFDFGRIVETYVSSNISKSTYGFQQNTNSYVSWYVKFGEEYGTTPTIYPSLTTSNTFYSWNGIIDFIPFQSYTQTPYVLQQAAVKQLQTNAISSGIIRDNEHAWIHAITATSGTIYEARVRTYDSAGALIQTVKVTNPYQAVSSANDRFVRFSAGTSNLNSINSSGIVLGSQPIITASVARYDITFETFAGVLTSNPFTYIVNNECTRNITYRFHFLNALGGFDSFTFIRGSQKTSTIVRTSYKKVIGGSTSSSTYGYSLTDRSDTDFNINIADKIKVQSDWINEATLSWLEELVTSPEVYLDDSTNGLIAVNIENASHEFKQNSQEKLFSLTIDFSFSYTRTRQRK